MKVSDRIALAKSMGGVSSNWKEAGFRNYSECQRVVFVHKHGIPRLLEQMDNGMPVSTCVRVARLSPDQQADVLDGKMSLPKHGGAGRHVRDWTMTPGELKTATFIEKVEAIMQDIANGHRLDECCARHSVGRDAYQRCRLVVKRNHGPLIDAINHGVVTPGESELLLKLDDESLTVRIEELTVAHEMVKADPRSRSGNFGMESLRSLLQRTYVEWRGVSFNVKISRILPITEGGIQEMRREAMNCRNAVNMVLDSLNKEIEKRCSRETTESRDGLNTWESPSNGSMTTHTLS